MNYSIVSILLPVKDEEKNINSCLLRLANQTYPLDKLELIVIDGLSADNTVLLIRRFIQNHPIKFKLIQDSRKQRSYALNLGIKQATGKIILRIDARAIISNNYIEECVKTLRETGADNVGGVQKAVQSDHLTQRAIACAMTHPFGVGNAQFRLAKKSGFVDSVYLGCFNAAVFEKVGLFDENSAVISEDSELNYRIRRQGGKIYLNKDIEVLYFPRDKLTDLGKLYFRYGGARAGFLLKWKTLTAWRQFLPPAFVLSLLFLPLLSLISPIFLYLWLASLSVYLGVDLASSFVLSRKTKNYKIFLPLLLVFPIIHFAWATGFLTRLLQRPNENSYWGY